MLDMLKEISAEAWVAISGFLVTNGAAILTMIITWVKTKIKNFNLEKEIEAMHEYADKKILEVGNQLLEDVTTKLDEMQNAIDAKVDENEANREKELEDSSKEFETALEDLKKDM